MWLPGEMKMIQLRHNWGQLKNLYRYCGPMLQLTMKIWVASLIACFILIMVFGRGDHLHEFLIALGGAVLAAIFQVSVAYHARVSHFLECFSRCNASYAELNGRLENRTKHAVFPTPNKELNDAVIDYFNLCAEEHLMHKSGVIPDEIWEVWCAGIHDLARKKLIRNAWVEEKKARNEYYGFDLEQIMGEHHKARGNECGKRLDCPWFPMTVVSNDGKVQPCSRCTTK